MRGRSTWASWIDSLRGFLILICLFFIQPSSTWAGDEAYLYHLSQKPTGLDVQENTLVGSPQKYIVKDNDTLLDIARNFDLGFSEMQLMYKEVDPWIPPKGLELVIPTQWVLPEGNWRGIVINIPEMRLYLFYQKISMVRTYPIGIGVEENTTPVGKFFIKEKMINPTWHIPVSLRAKYEGKTKIPPGPDNPLGSHWLGLSVNGYGIHGTNIPWAVGRLVTHGCIRLYPEDIIRLYPIVPVGTPVHIIYEPIKIGFQEGRIFVEVHEDIYHRIPDLHRFALGKLERKKVQHLVDGEKLEEAINRKRGLPEEVTLERAK
jgi:L,D-transpeptidase ErfK/SrfK